MRGGHRGRQSHLSFEGSSLRVLDSKFVSNSAALGGAGANPARFCPMHLLCVARKYCAAQMCMVSCAVWFLTQQSEGRRWAVWLRAALTERVGVAVRCERAQFELARTLLFANEVAQLAPRNLHTPLLACAVRS